MCYCRDAREQRELINQQLLLAVGRFPGAVLQVQSRSAEQDEAVCGGSRALGMEQARNEPVTL